MKEKGWDVTMSVGVFTAAGPAMDAEEIIHRADELMYAAKVSGKNEVCLSPAPPSHTA